MGIFDLWKEARGTVLKNDYEDIVARLNNANPVSWKAYHRKLREVVKDYQPPYEIASQSERKRFLKECRQSSAEFWNNGYWPQALGIGAGLIYIESQFTPGTDAEHVRLAIDGVLADPPCEEA